MLESLLGRPAVLFFSQSDCPACRLARPYIERLAREATHAAVLFVSQDPEAGSHVDEGLSLSRRFDLETVPTVIWLDAQGRERRRIAGLDKDELNRLASELCARPVAVADPWDGHPARKPGCMSRHLEPVPPGPGAGPSTPRRHRPATRHTLPEHADPIDFCVHAGFSDGLPVVPPTEGRVAAMMEASGLASHEIVAHIPPNYGAATVEKIAANAVMAACEPRIMRVLIPLLRAACDERFNLHGVQATTHFATPLVILNGPVRGELGFASGSNVFSNAARANSTLGRAFQLILYHLGGARPGEIDMSALGNPGKFSYVIAENEEENPWEPLHVTRGFAPHQSAVTLFAAEPPRGVSEHVARDGRALLKTISRALATVWSYRVCKMPEALVVLGPEHVRTLRRDGFDKTAIREFLFEHTAIPVRHYDEYPGEGVAAASGYERVIVDGEPCYRKFAAPEALTLAVAGGTAGKFSAVIGSWATGPRGSQMVTYPVP